MQMTRSRAFLVLLTSLLLGCTPESQILSGKWYSSGPIPLTVEGDETVNMEMVLGHFGPDVVGTIRLSKPSAPMDCTCGAILHGEYRTGGLFRFFVEDAVPCIAKTESNEQLLESPGDGLDLHVEVTLLEEELSGVVLLRYLDPAASTPIVFLKDETDPFISEGDKTCP
jgi:hypothetical protein